MRKFFAALAVTSALAATATLAADDGLDLVLGRALFERDWVTAGASTDAADGLGPFFNARACAGCHGGEALAARFTPATDGRMAGRGLVVRFADATGAPDPLYGHQLQTQAIAGLAAEGRVVIASNGEGQEVAFEVDGLPLAEATHASVRVAPPLLGRGALEAISDASILAHADPTDRDGDGISGRANWLVTDDGNQIGRYGWKALNANLAQQVADAFALDLGLGSPLAPHPFGDCTSAQGECLAAPSGASDAFEGQELSTEMVTLVRDFVASLPAPAIPGMVGEEGAAGGNELFAATGCASCHVPEMADDAGNPVRAFTDLLLHDLGPALDDGMGEPGVASAEWRTAPLIALTSPGRRYLHDGRAGNVDAAVRAHGGEADDARSRYGALAEEDRQALIAFLASL